MNVFSLINCQFDNLIPIECFLNRVFPAGFYDSEIEDIVDNRMFKPRKDCTPFAIERPVDWQGTIYSKDRNWRMQLQGWAMFHPLMNFFDEYDDKPALVEYFFDVVEDWLETHGADNERVTTSRMPDNYAWYDMSVGFRALVIAFFINRINVHGIELDSKKEKLLAEATSKHINNLCFEDAFSLNNHGFFQIQGLMALIQLTNVDEKESKLGYALQKMEELIFSQFTNEGIHKEHSPHYHFYSTDTALSVLKTGWYESSSDIREVVGLAEYNKCWMVDPLKRPVCIGDSILTEQKNLKLPPSEGVSSISGEFLKSGYAIVKSDWQGDVEHSHMLFFMGMYHTKSHKHRDCLSFELFDSGRRVLCDSGKYGYKSDKYRNYFLSNRAHNTVEIEGFDIIKIKPYGTCLQSYEIDGNGCYVLKGNLDYPAIKHSRVLIYQPNNWLLVKDDLKFVKGRKFTQWFHFGPRFKIVTMQDNYFKLSDQSGKVVEIECLNDSVKPEFYFGDEGRMQGFISEKDYRYESAIAIGFTGHSDKEQLKTIIKYGDDVGFKKYIDDDIELRGHIISSDTKKALSNPILSKVRHFFFDENEKLTFPVGKSTTSFIQSTIPFSFYLDRKKCTDSLMVLLPGAVNRSKGCIDFQRHSWSSEFDSHVMSISDPTIEQSNDLSIGWFQYKNGLDCITALKELILKVASSLKVHSKDITLFGSSAGGFTAMKLGEMLKDSDVVAINPQIYLNQYTRSHFEAMANYSYGSLEIESNSNKFHERIEIDALSLSKRNRPTFIVQNKLDVKHFERHLKRFMKIIPNDEYAREEVKDWGEIKGGKLVNIVVYEDEILKHSPPNREETLKLLGVIRGINVRR